MKNKWSFKQGDHSLTEDRFGVFHLQLGGETLASGPSPYPLLVQALREGWMTYDEVLGAANALKIDNFFVQELECTNLNEQ